MISEYADLKHLEIVQMNAEYNKTSEAIYNLIHQIEDRLTKEEYHAALKLHDDREAAGYYK